MPEPPVRVFRQCHESRAHGFFDATNSALRSAAVITSKRFFDFSEKGFLELWAQTLGINTIRQEPQKVAAVRRQAQEGEESHRQGKEGHDAD
jgi:hypothetical protein